MKRSDARGALTRRMYILAAVLAFFAFVYGGFAVETSDGVFGVLAAAFAGLSLFFVRRGRYLRRAGRATTAINEAYAALAAGRTTDAEALWATITPEELRIPYLRRAVASQKSIAAMNRGDLSEAVTNATQAIEGAMARATRPIEEMQVDAARSLRALAQASLGDREKAFADVAAVETSSSSSSLARASLARAVLLARDRNFEALHAHYAAEGAMLIDALTPRERALSRALRRMGRPRTRSVYREAAALDDVDDANVDGAKAWIRKVAPEAAKFAAAPAKVERVDADGDGAAGTDAPRDAASTAAARKAIDLLVSNRNRVARRRAKLRSLGVVCGTFGVLAVVWGAVAAFASDSAPTDAALAAKPLVDPALLTTVGAGIGTVAIGVAALLLVLRRARGHRQRFLRASLTLARKDDPAAYAELEALSKTGLTVRRIDADRALATMAVRRGDFARALTDTERTLQRTSTSNAMRAATQDLFTPDMIATHAYALAALDRPDEALAELGMLERDYPSFPFAARASFRVHLMNAIRAGNYREAARISHTRAPDMPVELRDDLLAELACAAAVGGLPEEAAEALRGELHDMPEIEAWLTKVAPGLQARIARGASGAANVRIAAMPAHVPEDAHELADPEPTAEEAKRASSVLDPRS